jgi:hypothetical protein
MMATTTSPRCSVSSPTASASVADEHTLRWCGVRDDSGALVACGADVRYLPNVPHLASIATAPTNAVADRRAVTAWISRRCFRGLASSPSACTHNETARRITDGLTTCTIEQRQAELLI